MNFGVARQCREIAAKLKSLPYLKDHGLDGIPETISKINSMEDLIGDDNMDSDKFSNFSTELGALLKQIERSKLFTFSEQYKINWVMLKKERKAELLKALKSFDEHFTNHINELNEQIIKSIENPKIPEEQPKKEKEKKESFWNFYYY